jgi:hypothetical protein
MESEKPTRRMNPILRNSILGFFVVLGLSVFYSSFQQRAFSGAFLAEMKSNLDGLLDISGFVMAAGNNLSSALVPSANGLAYPI